MGAGRLPGLGFRAWSFEFWAQRLDLKVSGLELLVFRAGRSGPAYNCLRTEVWAANIILST